MRFTSILLVLLGTTTLLCGTGFVRAQGEDPEPERLAATVTSKKYAALLDELLHHSVPEIGVSQIDSTLDAVFLDARSREEYGISHIPGARWVGYKEFNLDFVEDLNRDQLVVVYCSVGYRSEKVAEKLMEGGFLSVANLLGGIFEWKNQGRTVVNDRGKTEAVHPYNDRWGRWLTRGEKTYP